MTMPNKFKIGDKVKVVGNSKTSKELLTSIRLDNVRTITAIFYDDKAQHTRYYLGTNKRGQFDLEQKPFRANELARIILKSSRGRKRTKRRYKRHPVNPQRISKQITHLKDPKFNVINT